MSNIKAIFLDIDGTLRDSDVQISPRTKKIIKEIVSRGIYVILSSGRNFEITKNLCEEVGASKILICCNGAGAVDYENNKVILEKKIDYDAVKAVYEYSQTHNCILTANEIYKEIKLKNKNELSDNIINLVIQSSNFDRMLILKDYFKEKVPNIEISNSSKHLINNNRVPNFLYFHDLSAPQTSKGNAVLEVMEYLNIKEEETLCIGDSINDLSMFLVCGTKVAMGNAIDIIKENSTEVIKSNDEEGVYYYLKEFVDNLNELN